MLVPVLTYQAKVTWYGHKELNKALIAGALWQDRGCDNFVENNQIFYTEYNHNFQDQYSCSCQETMKFGSYTGYTRLMSKTYGPLNLPCVLDY